MLNFGMIVMMLGAVTVRTVAGVDPAAAVGDSIPWPVQLGLNGVTLGALVSFFIWQNRQISRGQWYPAMIVDKMLAEKDSTIAEKDTQIAGKDLLIDEQRKTIRANESTADTMSKALVQATSNQSWVDVVVQRALGGVAAIPKKGDNGAQEVGPT